MQKIKMLELRLANIEAEQNIRSQNLATALSALKSSISVVDENVTTTMKTSGNGSSSACNQPWYLDKALTRVGCLLSWAGGTLSFATAKSLINSGRPPCARQGWSGGGGHFMAIVCHFEGLLGLIVGGGSTAKRLRISDPWYGDSVVDYDVFVSGYQGTGTWTHSYRTQP